MTNVKILAILESDEQIVGVVWSPSDSFEAIIDIHGLSEEQKLLGELVCFTVTEWKNEVLVLWQITEIQTKNQWHEEPAFKGIIKRHWTLPNLSWVADNRIAKITVQSSFIAIDDTPEAHKLANSPSTWKHVKKVTNEIMKELMSKYKGKLVTIWKAYDTDVDVPFWFKHFGNPKDGGGGDAYHIGVFGRTWSGKTTTAANMILGYAQNAAHMNILILDPQGQFYEDIKVLPTKKFETEITALWMKYEKLKVPEDISLPNNAKLFSELLLNYWFIRSAFKLGDSVQEYMMDSIKEYIEGRMSNPGFSLETENAADLLENLLKRFNDEPKYLENVYVSGQHLTRLKKSVGGMVDKTNPINVDASKIWHKVCALFNSDKKKKLDDIVEQILTGHGSTIVLNISGRWWIKGMESIETLFVKIIEDAIKDKWEELFATWKPANCLVVLDEAHRYISTYSFDDESRALTTSIIDAVRTTRKYGIWYMFITQTIESLHAEIRGQIRIFAFGYWLTSWSEFAKIKDVINDEAGAKFYRSFIDPTSNNKFPFMFYGPISPLSFTWSPLFLEMNNQVEKFDE